MGYLLQPIQYVFTELAVIVELIKFPDFCCMTT